MALQSHAALIWMGVALAIGMIETVALKDGYITLLDLWLTAATVPLSYVCVGESIRQAYGFRRSRLPFFLGCFAAILCSLVLLSFSLPPVLQFLPAQITGAVAMLRAARVVRKAGSRRDPIDIGLLLTLAIVSAIYIARIPVFPVLVGMEVPFSAISRQGLQDILIVSFSILVPAVVFLMVARVVASSLQLYRMRAELDFLTNLPNRRAFESMASQPARGSGALVVCDIDKFKRINDRYGHAAGDAVICAVASLLYSRGRPARIGGEEFAIWLPDADAADARRHAEQLRREMMTLRLVELADDQQITASFGIAVCGPLVPLVEAMRAADEALYLAKNAGRNCVCVYGEQPEQREPGSYRERAAA
ncbi:MAG: GGDEF domain-containing protein [Alteraurantiacibacter sp.]